jgi:hypothetical protein
MIPPPKTPTRRPAAMILAWLDFPQDLQVSAASGEQASDFCLMETGLALDTAGYERNIGRIRADQIAVVVTGVDR